MTANQSALELEKNLKEIREKTAQALRDCGRGDKVRIMAVTKTVEPWRVNQALGLGIDLIGENRVQELLEKYDSYDRDKCEIHFIGHLQTNKVKYIIDKVDMIESVDSLHLAAEIERRCVKTGRTMDILVQINAGREESKFGVYPEELPGFLEMIPCYPHLRVKGLMAVVPKCEENAEICKYFMNMDQLFLDSQRKNGDNITMGCLSMGMSGDYVLAVQNGATIIRIGRGLFGERLKV